MSANSPGFRAEAIRDRVELRDGVLFLRKLNRPVTLRRDADGYHRFTLNYRGRCLNFAAHRAIWLLHHGEWPKHQIDHINRDPADNRIENLRDVTPLENVRNRTPFLFAGAGIWADTRSDRRPVWRAAIQHAMRRYFLGSFATRQDALDARLHAQEELKAGREPRANWCPAKYRPTEHRRRAVRLGVDPSVARPRADSLLERADL